MNEISSTARLFLLLGSANAALAVMLGAFGAHALKARLGEHLIKVYQTGIDYHFCHALGLLLIGIIAMNIPVTHWLRVSGWSMFAGIILFCGSLYLLSVLNLRWLGMVTPVGGVLFITAWVCLFMAIIKT